MNKESKISVFGVGGKRINQNNVLPSAIKGKNIDKIIFGSGVTSASTSMSNGDQIIVTMDLSQNSEFEILAIPYFSVYVGSVTANNQLPGGSAIDESQWQVIGPWYDQEDWAATSYARETDIAKLYIRNISAGTVNVYIYIKWRYVSPREGAQ